MKRFVLMALSVVLLAGCGVRPTGVIPAGPAPAFPSSPQNRVILYFVVGDRLTSTARPVTGQITAVTALRALLTGPTPEEQRRGLGTLLPTAGRVVDNGQLTVTLPIPLEKLSKRAFEQLTCTALNAGDTRGVTIAAAEQTVTYNTCLFS